MQKICIQQTDVWDEIQMFSSILNKIKKRDLLSVFIYLDMCVYNHLELWAHAIQWKRAFEMYCDKSNPIHYFKTIDNDPSEQKLVFDHLKKARSNLS